MKRILTLLFVVMTVFTCGCDDNYDDSALWKDIDGMYKDLKELQSQVASMQQQLNALNAIIGQGALTGITQDSDGHYVITYKDAQDLEHTLIIATMEDVNTQPIVGVKAEGGIYYWTTTVKGQTSWLLDVDQKKIPITGRTPEIGINADGCWTIFGQPITDATGKPVRAEGKSASVITNIVMQDNGTAILTLGDGVEVTMPVQNGFNVRFIDTQVSTQIINSTQPLVIHYELIGETKDSILSIEKTEGVTAQLDLQLKTLTITFPTGFEEGRVIVMFYDGVDNTILKPLYFTTSTGAPTGICSADDLKAFATAVNNGKSLAKYTINGEICLMNDIDLSGIDWSLYMIGGITTSSTTTANTAVTYTVGDHGFSKIFNGQDHTIKNINWTFNLADGNITHGLFSALSADGEIKNLTLEGAIRLTGAAPQGATMGAFAGYVAGKITACTNKTSITFAGTDAANISVCLGGIAGYTENATLTDCINDGTLTCGAIVNTGNATNSGFHEGGICGFMKNSDLIRCINNGALSAPTGRSGGIVAVATSGNILSCVNNGLVQDDINSIFGVNPAYKRMGGIAGGTTSKVTLTSCINSGNVFSQLGCRTGGFVGHNEGKIIRCENRGTILSDLTVVNNGTHGAGWAAGYNKSADLISECIIGGRVGDYSVYKTTPASTPTATYNRAVAQGDFTPTTNGLTDQSDAYYDWTVVSDTELGSGVKYTHYALTNINQNIYVIEADLSNPKVVLETVMADEIVLNPNANNNSNNGKNLRETCSETCVRRRDEGRNILAGINTGFFNSHDGFPRGCHVEYGEPVFVNNPDVRLGLTNHIYGFTLFEDHTTSFENRTFKGSVKVNETEYEYYSINDTIVRLNKVKTYDANLYTSRFVKTPHPGINNPVGSQALFVVCRNTSAPLTVNSGYIDAQVTAVVDGRKGTRIEVPFVTAKTDWVLQLTGATADRLATLKVGDALQIRADFSVGNTVKPIITHNASMYRFLNKGSWKSVSDDSLFPATCLGANESGQVVKLVCVDGRTKADIGMNYWQLYKTMKKLGLYNAIRFDGGGSTTMWRYVAGTGAVVNHPCDERGERSCLNYIHVRLLE